MPSEQDKRTHPELEPKVKGSSRAVAERRREPRQPAMGRVVIHLDHGARTIEGEMVDISPSGFRIRYRGEVLRAGTQVDISYPWGEVKASIMWVRVAEGWVDMGFLILP